MLKPRTTVHLLTAGLLLLGSAAAQQSTTQSSPASKPPASQAQKPATGATAADPLPTQKDKISYAIGMNIGKGLHHDNIDVDPNLVLRGLKDAIAGNKLLLSEEQAQATMMALQSQVRQKMAAEQQKAEAENKKDGDAFLAANKTKPGIVTLPSGLQYKILKEGTGPKPALTDTVKCNYKGTLINGNEFDSSEKHGGQPVTFPVNGVIKGWTEALQLMPVGSKWQLFIPPDLAYGARGAGDVIGPDQTLIFEVDLLSIEKKEPAAEAPQQPAANPQAQPAASQQQPAAKPQ